MPKLHHAPGILITEIDGDFICPICTCPNTYDDYAAAWEKLPYPYGKIRCRGCKRPLIAYAVLNGDIHVKEIDPQKPQK